MMTLTIKNSRIFSANNANFSSDQELFEFLENKLWQDFEVNLPAEAMVEKIRNMN